MSTLCVLYTPHFPHSRIQNTLQSMFSTFHSPRYPQFTLHYTALSLPLLPSPLHGLAPKFPTPPSPRAVSQTNSIPLPCWTPAMQAITHSSFSTLYTTLHLACPSPPPHPLIPRAQSRAQISFPFHFERLPRRPHRTPRFPHHALLLLQTTIYTASKIDFLEFICRLSYNRWRCLATLKFFSKDSKTAI